MRNENNATAHIPPTTIKMEDIFPPNIGLFFGLYDTTPKNIMTIYNYQY
jgi:hypothetical protein